MPRSLTWVNKDGLIVGGGRHTADNAIPAHLATENGELHTILIRIPDMSLLNDDVTDTTGTDVGLYSQGARLPAGATVVEVRTVAKTACTGTSSTLLIGNYTWNATTRVYTAVDADGFMDATDGALANFSATGETRRFDISNSAAALLGEVQAHSAVSMIFPTYGTAFDTGAVDVYIDYVLPR